MGSPHVLVTGASGLIGSEVLNVLHRYGYDLTGVSHNLNGYEFPWHAVSHDLSSNNLPMNLIKPETVAIVHCAALLPVSDFKQAYMVNRSIDKHVLRTAQTVPDVKLIYMSGTSVYGMEGSECNEETRVSPNNDYILGKIESEKEIFSQLANAVVLRLSSPYGVKLKQNTVLKLFVERAKRNEHLKYHGSGERSQDFIACEDIAKSVLRSVESSGAGLYNIASGCSVSMRQLAKLIVELTPDCSSEVMPSGLDDPQDDYRANINIEKARNYLKWEPTVSLPQGLHKMIHEIGFAF